MTQTTARRVMVLMLIFVFLFSLSACTTFDALSGLKISELKKSILKENPSVSNVRIEKRMTDLLIVFESKKMLTDPNRNTLFHQTKSFIQSKDFVELLNQSYFPHVSMNAMSKNSSDEVIFPNVEIQFSSSEPESILFVYRGSYYQDGQNGSPDLRKQLDRYQTWQAPAVNIEEIGEVSFSDFQTYKKLKRNKKEFRLYLEKVQLERSKLK